MSVFFILLILFGLSVPTHAYLDPNSGSGLVAFLIALAAGLAFYGKKMFYAVKNRAKKISRGLRQHCFLQL